MPRPGHDEVAAAAHPEAQRLDGVGRDDLVLRGGETTTFNVATDKVSGDTIRAQVTITALK